METDGVHTGQIGLSKLYLLNSKYDSFHGNGKGQTVQTYCNPKKINPLGPRPTSDIRPNSKFDQHLDCFGFLYVQPITTNLHSPRYLHCRDVCKIILRSTEYIMNRSITKMSLNSSSIEISLVGQAPGNVLIYFR